MDNNTLAITVSAGAIGATLAYLGYNNYLNRDATAGDNDTEQEKTDRAPSRADVNSPRNTIVSKKSPVDDNEQEKVKQEVKKEVQSKKEVKSEWGQFWKGEYETQRDNADASQEVQAGEYN